MNRSAMRIVPLLIILLSSLLGALPVQANVNLSYFRIDQGASPSQLIVAWATETETDTAAFIIQRSTTNNAAQAADITTVQATGTAVGGKEYEYVDNGVTPGQVYYYWLIELTRGNVRNPLGTVQQVTAGSTETPTTPAPTATPTTQPTATLPPTATPPPTATQPVQAAAQSTPQSTATTQPLVQDTPVATNTAPPAATSAPASPPLPAATNAPVNPAITAPATAAAAPDVQDAAAKDAAATAAATGERSEGQSDVVQDAAATTAVAEGQGAATAAPASGETAPAATATPQTVAEAAPAQEAAPQAQLLRPTATPRPSGSSTGGNDASSLLTVIAGGAVCGAGLLALVVFFVWRRR